MEFAASENLVVVSHDVNTMVAEAMSRLERELSIAGLLLVHQWSALAPIIDDLILIWAASERKEWINQVCFLPL